MKKVISVLLVICMLFSMSTMCLAGAAEAQLKFDENGRFRMMVICDPQTQYPVAEDLLKFIGETMDNVKPDLVVFGGDIVNNEDDRTYEALLAPIVERNVPFTLVFGNHDEETSGGQTKEEILEIYQSIEGCLAYDADPALHGCGTHNLPVMSSDGSKVAFNLWMFDSGSYYYDEEGNYMGYDWVRADQIEWYNNTRDAMTEANGGELVPAMAFQHIIPQEPCEKIFLPTDLNLGDITFNFQDGTHLTVVPDITKYDGYIFEKSCPGYGNDGQWDAFVQGGDVLGLVVGHDHVNNFIADVDGVDLIQTPGATYDSYQNEMFQGVRIIDINESNPWEYSTFNVTVNEIAIKDGSEMGEDRDNSTYQFQFALYNFFQKFYEFFLKIFSGEL